MNSTYYLGDRILYYIYRMKKSLIATFVGRMIRSIIKEWGSSLVEHMHCTQKIHVQLLLASLREERMKWLLSIYLTAVLA